MLGNKFDTRLNSFYSKSNNSNLTAIDLINRAAKVEGLTDIDLNYPDHVRDDFKSTLNCAKNNGLNINGFAMRYYSNEKFKLGELPTSIIKEIFLFFKIIYPPNSLLSFLKV